MPIYPIVNLPDASATNRGAVNTLAQSFAGAKTFTSIVVGDISGNAGTVTNGLYSNGSYSDPTWLTSIAGSKVSGDISGSPGKILGISLTGSPSNGQVLGYNGSNWLPVAGGAAGFYSATSIGVLTTNTGAQNSTAIEAAFTAMEAAVTAWVIQFGIGVYYFDRTIICSRPVTLQGTGGGPHASTWFYFPDGQDGIHTIWYTPATNKYGSGTTIRDLGLYQQGPTTTGNGISIRGLTYCKNVHVENWKENGFSVDASTGDGNNANSFVIEYCFAGSCRGNGYYFNGADSNAGTILGCVATSNTGIGFYDSSFLGNTFMSCEADSNAGGSYKCDDPNARTMFLNCYHEGGQPLPDLTSSRAIWFAGLCDQGQVIGGTSFQDGIWSTSYAHASGGASYSNNSYIGIGSATQEFYQTYLRMAHVNMGGAMVLTHFNATANAFEKLYTGYGTVGEQTCILGTKVSNRWGVPATSVYPNGFYLGTQRIFSYYMAPDATVLAASNWERGDVVTNYYTPDSTGFLGWICTAPGTSGAYTEGRTATADGTVTVVLNAASGLGWIQPGAYLTINSVTRRVNDVNADWGTVGVSTLTMNGTVPAGSGLAIAFSPPTFVAFGPLAGTFVAMTGDQTVAGTKTFSSTITGSISGNAGTVTNGLYSTGSYSDPTWLTALAGSKISGTVTASFVGNLSAAAASSETITANIADGASAVGTIIDNSVTLATAGAKIASFRNHTVEKAYITLAGAVVAGSGTAAAPALTFAGDPTSGFYSISTNLIGVSIGGTFSHLLYAAGGTSHYYGPGNPAASFTTTTASLHTLVNSVVVDAIDITCTPNAAGTTKFTTTVQLNTSGIALPTANAAHRGQLWYSLSAGGAADTVQICLKSAGDTYSWVTLATG